MATPKLTPKRLRELLDYNPETGLFVWRIRASNRISIGQTAGNKGFPYVKIRIDGKPYFAHRLAWLYITNNWPDGEIDHRDGIRTNNCFNNLRPVTRSINNENKKRALKNSTTGVLGVYPKRRKFRTEICTKGKRRYLGTFNTIEEAHVAYIAAKRKYHEGYTI